MCASCPRQKFHSWSRFPSLFLSSLGSFSVLFLRAKLSECVALWFALTPPPTQMIDRTEKPIQSLQTRSAIQWIWLQLLNSSMRLIWAWLRPYLIPKWPHPTLQAEALEDWRASARSVNHTLTQHGSSFYFQKRYFFTLNTKQYMYLMGENVTVWPRISLVRPNSAIFTQYYWDGKCVCHFHIGASPLPLRSATPIQVISNLGNLDV